MKTQIESSFKVVVSAALAAIVTLIVISGIGNSTSDRLAKLAAVSAQTAAMTSALNHAG